MYVAKNDRSGYAVYAAGRDHHTERRLTLLSSMRNAIESNQFALDYQPIVNLRTGDVMAVEALLRWDHPEQGRLLPKDFIQVAEHSGLITPLTAFAIGRALADWPPHSRPGTIAVNLSPRSLHDTAFPRRVAEMLDVNCVSAACLAMEITENIIMLDPERSTSCLNELHEMGVRLIVDDFGTGYSSLSYLRRLPVDQLKIDKSFVIGLANGEDDALVRSIIDLAHNLRLGVIAEGVETGDVCDRLRRLGCDGAQGHFFSAPTSASDTVEWMRQRKAAI
jgi:diguanylate cyclase